MAKRASMNEANAYGGGGLPGALRTGIQQSDVDAAVAAALADAPSSDPDDDINLFYNGRFESALIGTDGWDITNPTVGTTMSRDTVDPMTGAASLKLHIGSDSGGIGVVSWAVLFDSDQYGDTLQLSFKHRGEDVALLVWLDYESVSDVESPVYLTAQAAVGVYEWEFVVPASPGKLWVTIGSDWNGPAQGNKTFWIDDILLKTIAVAP